MNQTRKIAQQLYSAFIFTALLTISQLAQSQDGKALFNQKCASCHAIDKQLVGPALKGVEDRWDDKKMLYEWVRNSASVIKKGYPRAVAVYAEFNKVQMTAFPELKDQDIDAILGYINTGGAKAAVAGTSTASQDAPGTESDSDSNLLYGILTLILAVIAMILLQVNSNLRKIADETEGFKTAEPIPFYRNKAYIAILAIILFLVGGFYTFQGAQGLGRSKDYQPEQPIFYSHTVHAGINQVNCLYCHGGAQESKHANIPSVNICMNCHMGINEYVKGPKLYRADGSSVDGTAEIQKIYKYAGWDPAAKKYTSKGKAIEWIRIHNLPDHVYFNHSQHVNAGKQQCQTCHGEIQKMDEVFQFSDLSMGWCVNCHRETKVQFTENKFYSIYEKFHEDLKNKKMDSVTVEKIGGIECQKCHY
ncbi:MAG: cytochrome C [Chitinophagaceae bacterium]|nr:MAG: cytochrome C [Chitinophagaceae bacterium]